LKRFALIGAAGYVAPRHMKAIKDTGNVLVAAMDPNDSVGILDSWFPDAAFFTEFERFDRHVDKLRRSSPGSQVELVSVCSPNYLHDSHVRFALRSGANAICEKPVVLNPWNIDGLLEIEQETGQKVYTILQLRLHPSIQALRKKVLTEKRNSKHEVELTYITGRGKWYLHSWKGDLKRSGGIATNIGVHFFDMLHFIFGGLQDCIVQYSSDTKAGGYLEYAKAHVRWFLSVDVDDLPQTAAREQPRTFRSITIDDVEVEFSGGFGDLHTKSYQEVLAGRGFGLEDNRVAIETVRRIRTMQPETEGGDHHPQVARLVGIRR
jgi:UDP-N-acetyl-2-amino-2-deoxyglucuronate dehydrogenase